MLSAPYCVLKHKTQQLYRSISTANHGQACRRDTYPEADSEIIFIAACTRVHLDRRPDADWRHRNVRHNEVLWPVSYIQQNAILCGDGREEGQHPHGVQIIRYLHMPRSQSDDMAVTQESLHGSLPTSNIELCTSCCGLMYAVRDSNV